MDTKKIIALVMIGIAVVILLVNRGLVDGLSVDLLVTTVSASKSMILLAAMAWGVVVGVLVK